MHNIQPHLALLEPHLLRIPLPCWSSPLRELHNIDRQSQSISPPYSPTHISKSMRNARPHHAPVASVAKAATSVLDEVPLELDTATVRRRKTHKATGEAHTYYTVLRSITRKQVANPLNLGLILPLVCAFRLAKHNNFIRTTTSRKIY